MVREGPKMGQEEPETAQEGPRRAARGAYEGEFEEAPRALKTFNMLPGGLQQTPKQPTQGPKRSPGDGPRGSQTAQEAAKRARRGPQDGPRGSQDGPRGAQNSRR